MPAEGLSVTGLHSLKKSLGEVRQQVTALDQRVNRTINEADRKASELAETVSHLHEEVTKELKRVRELHADSLDEFEGKRKQIDQILGHASGSVIAGEFSENASSERKVADWLRYASLVCMGLVVVIVGYAFWETTTKAFDWQAAVFRLVLAFLLSVPAGYLARESVRHRRQQYSYLQTSLDLKAIAPYLSSLPDDEQHRIKAEVARRIFGNGGRAEFPVDTGVQNLQELIIDLAKRLEVKGQK